MKVDNILTLTLLGNVYLYMKEGSLTKQHCSKINRPISYMQYVNDTENVRILVNVLTLPNS